MKNIKTHMGWAIAVLLALFIGSLAVKWSTLQEVPTIISIALGLSSLVLAMVAIFQSMSAGSGLSQTLGKIDHAAARTTEASSALSYAASTFLAKASTLDNINPSLEALHQRLADVVNSDSKTSNSTYAQESTSPTISSADRDAQQIYGLATIGFNVAVYIAKLSQKHNKQFRADEIFPEEEYIQGSITGYLVSLRAAQLIEMEYINGTILVTNLGPFTEEVIDERMDQSAQTDTFGRLRPVIEAYFSDSPPQPVPAETSPS